MTPTNTAPLGHPVDLIALNEALSEVWGAWPFASTAADKVEVTERTIESFLRAFNTGERDPAVLKYAALAPFRLLQSERRH